MAKFLIKDGIYWDDEKTISEQSQAAQQWLDETRRSNADKIIKDNYGRPIQFIYEANSAILTVEHIYIEKHSTNWSLDRIKINVTKK